MPSDSINILAALGSVVSALVAIAALLYSYLQSNIKKYEVKRDYRNAIIIWFSETTQLLLELRFLLIDAPDVYKIKKVELLSNLSRQIEVGRLYFPNIDKHDGYGKEKPKAFQGYRNLTLDFLVYSFNIFLKSDAKNYEGHLIRLQREYTSIICGIIDPEDFLNETKKHSDKFFAHKLSYGEFLAEHPDNRDLFFPKASNKQ